MACICRILRRSARLGSSVTRISYLQAATHGGEAVGSVDGIDLAERGALFAALAWVHPPDPAIPVDSFVANG